MNKQRRKTLDTLYQKIEALSQELNEVLYEEQEAYDNLPESLQESDRGCQMYDAIDNIASALQNLEEAQDYILEAVDA